MQFHVAVTLDGCSIGVIPPGEKHFTNVWWTDGKQVGKYSPSGKRVPGTMPQHVVQSLRNALPCPKSGLYSYTVGGRVIALYQSGESNKSDEHYTFAYVLEGATEPDLHATVNGIPITLCERWWRDVDNGRIKSVDELLANSVNPVLWGTRHDYGWYVLVNEPWTGVKGPALYVCPLVKGRITLQEAIQRGGTDIRSRFK